jgi:hypothetical protein
MRTRQSLEQLTLALVASALVAAVIMPIAGHVNNWIGLVTAIGCFTAMRWIARHVPAAFTGGLRRHPFLAVVWFVLAMAAVAQIGRLSAFMADSSRVWGSTVPDPVAARHQCLAAYVYAADLSRHGQHNIYDTRLYQAFTQPPGTPTGMQSPVVGLSPWIEDPYQYPPPFLLLPRIALALTQSFETIRASWFILQTLAWLAGAVLLAVWIGGREGRTVALLIPLVLSSIPTMLNLQFGQFHAMTFLLALGGLVAFDREKPALGGALLASSIVAKIFPAVLLLGLVARRRWRELWWTLACGSLLSIAALAILGRDPFIAFFSYQLPRLADGEAFSFIARNGTPVFFMSRNFSIASIVPKLHLLGVDGVPPQAAAVLSLAYAVLVLWLAWRASSGDGARLHRAQRWVAVLNLAALCSPLAPSSYVAAPTLWLLALLAGEVRGRVLRAFSLGAAWVVVVGAPPLPDAIDLAIGLIAQIVLVAINIWVLRRAAPAIEVDGKENIDAFDASTRVASSGWRVRGALLR